MSVKGGTTMKYGFIGCGNMGGAIAKALASKGEQGTMGAKDVYYDGDGVTSQLMIVLELSINVGTKAFQSQRNLTQTMQDLIDNNLDNYGKGSWVESVGRDIYTFCIGFKGTDMIYNSVEENNFISYDGGFLIPVTQDMTGHLTVKIRNVFTMNYETLGNYTSRIIEGFQVSLLQTAPSFYSDNTTNKYKRNLDNNFKAEITKSLKLGTIKINQPSPALLLTENGYLKTLPYNPSAIVNERPQTRRCPYHFSDTDAGCTPAKDCCGLPSTVRPRWRVR